jgi:hypothetical protein
VEIGIGTAQKSRSTPCVGLLRLDQRGRRTRLLHDLILGQTAVSIRVHGIATTAGREVLDEAQAQRPAAVLVALEFGDRGLGCCNAVESHDSGSAGTTTGLVLDLSLFDLTDCGKELDQIFIAGGPWELYKLVAGYGVSGIPRSLHFARRWSRWDQYRSWRNR